MARGSRDTEEEEVRPDARVPGPRDRGARVARGSRDTEEEEVRPDARVPSGRPGARLRPSSDPVTGASLLDHLELGPRTVRNRVVFGPHETNLGRERRISERHVAYYRRRAAGGAGLIVTEEASVHPSDWPYERAPLAAECGPGWAEVVGACHQEGSLVVAAIGHSGGQGSAAYSQQPLWAPSRVPEVATREVPKWMEPDDIAAVVGGFAAATALAAESGLDGVEVNAGQHSLLRQFLSGLTNQRSDEWGSDRELLIVEVLRAVRAAAGPGTLLGLRLSCDEMAPWAGITPDAGADLAGRLAPLVDYLTVVRGSIYTASATRPDGHTPAGFNLDLTAAVREAVAGRTAIIAQGSIVDVGMAEAAVAGWVADGVEMTRAQIADPDLVRKLMAGAPEQIRPCILCNQACQVRDNRNPLVSCVVEPAAGHETEDPPVPRGDGPEDVGPGRNGRSWGDLPGSRPPGLLVVGAGVAGLECARVAALAGRRVTVAERAPSPGGILPLVATGAGRERLAGIVDWLEAECRRLGVEVTVGRAVDVEQLAEWAGPVVLCTGSRPGERTYPISPGAVVIDSLDALEGDEVPASATVAVWDPIGGSIAVSVAEALAADGHMVRLLTPDFLVGTMLSRSGDLAPANVRLHAAGVELHRRVDLVRAGPGEVEVRDRFAATAAIIEADVLVDCGPRLANDELWRASGECRPRAGDAVAPRSIYEAVLEGRRAAQALETSPATCLPRGGRRLEEARL